MPLTPPDPETAGILKSALTALGTFAAGGFGLYKIIDRRIEKKADAEVVAGHGRALVELAANAREDKTEIRELVEHRASRIENYLDQIEETGRMDRRLIMDGIQRLSEQNGSFQVEAMRALGERPTREDISEMINDKIRAAART